MKERILGSQGLRVWGVGVGGRVRVSGLLGFRV